MVTGSVQSQFALLKNRARSKSGRFDPAGCCTPMKKSAAASEAGPVVPPEPVVPVVPPNCARAVPAPRTTADAIKLAANKREPIKRASPGQAGPIPGEVQTGCLDH